MEICGLSVAVALTLVTRPASQQAGINESTAKRLFALRFTARKVEELEAQVAAHGHALRAQERHISLYKRGALAVACLMVATSVPVRIALALVLGVVPLGRGKKPAKRVLQSALFVALWRRAAPFLAI